MTTQTAGAEVLQVVVFSLADTGSKKKGYYGVGIEHVREIRPLENITIVPNAPVHVRGIMNLRGKIIPVIDLKQRMGITVPVSEESEPRSCILVAEVGSTLAGLLVDDVDRVLQIPTKDIEPSMPAALESTQYIIGIAKTGGRLIVLLDLSKLVEGSDSKHVEKIKEGI